MTEKTEVRIRETRKLLDDIDGGMWAVLIFVASVCVGVLSGVASAQYVRVDVAFVSGLGHGVACLAGLFALAWVRRAWLIARVNFEILTDSASAVGQQAEQSVEVEGAILEGLGIVFAVAMVSMPDIMDNRDREQIYREWLSDSFEDFAGKVIVLAYREADGRVTYQGRPELVDLLADVAPNAIPWQKFRSA